VFALVYVASIGFVASTLGALPDPVASSFGPSGAARAYMTRAVYARVYVGFSFVIPLAVVAGLCWLPRRFPQLSNIPRRAFWLAPENRARLHALLDRGGFFLGSVAALFFAATHGLLLEANAQRPARLANGPFLGMLFGFLASTVGTAIWLSLTLRRTPPMRAPD